MTLWPLLLSLSASAVEPSPNPLLKQCDPNDETSCVQYLRVGDTAEFSGPQFTTGRAARLGVKAEQCQARIDLAVEEAKELLNIDLSLQIRLRAIDKDAAGLQRQLLQESLERAVRGSQRGWYEHPLLWTGVGVVLTTLTVAGAVAVIRETSPSP